jgi:hypothetical protein
MSMNWTRERSDRIASPRLEDRTDSFVVVMASAFLLFGFLSVTSRLSPL